MHPLAPLLILFTILGVLAFIGYAVYTISNDIADKTSKKMQKKNILVTKDGMKVGVKEVKEESYVDTTQSFLVKAWNYSTWPAYKSRLWNQQEAEHDQPKHRSPFSRHGSTSNGVSKAKA
ncbi:hypothetical protein G7Y79_00003g011940 [Physcia stellaris]|nr:hypothetical protein G7Y79_00003g011940 [Physcia stellaris]